jgi:transcriptional regulator with XRE-family HTH domain
MSLGEIIKKTRKSKRLTQGAVAKKCDITIGYLSEIETNKKTPSVDTLKKIAGTLEYPVSHFLGEVDDRYNKRRIALEIYSEYKKAGFIPDDFPEPTDKDLESFFPDDTISLADSSPMELITVPVYDADTCAGDGWSHEYMDVELIENVALSLADVGPISVYKEKQPFAVIVKGDSMIEAGLRAGDRVCINPAAEVHDGDAALVVYGPDRTAALKWVYFHRDGGVELRSASVLYPPRVFTKEQLQGEEFCFEIIGKVMLYFGRPQRGL